MGIGGKLKSGRPHDGRAPDYDDWSLNGDILMWDSVGQRSLEVSSMGIRVDEESLERQLKLAGCEARRELPFHRMLLNGELPLTMGGGIGQSRVSMLLLGKAHIGEVQSSLWDEENIKACQEAGGAAAVRGGSRKKASPGGSPARPGGRALHGACFVAPRRLGGRKGQDAPVVAPHENDRVVRQLRGGAAGPTRQSVSPVQGKRIPTAPPGPRNDGTRFQIMASPRGGRPW